MGETIQMSDIHEHLPSFTQGNDAIACHSNDQKKIGLQFYDVLWSPIRIYKPRNLDIFADVYFVNGFNLPTKVPYDS